MANAVRRFLVRAPIALRRFGRDRQAVTAMEYALIAACVALAFISIAILLGDDVASMFENLGDSVQDVSGSGD